MSENIDSLYDLVSLLSTNIDGLINMGNNNKITFSNKYSFDSIYKDMTNMILEEQV